jgi:DNA-directed RNA polymerase I subunit RPA1
VEIEPVKDKEGADVPLKPVESAAASAKIGQLLSGSEGKENFAALDGYMQSQLNPLASEIIKACLPNGLAVPFPVNVSLCTDATAYSSNPRILTLFSFHP